MLRGEAEGVPYQVLGPKDGLDGSRPLVLVAHGLAGSGTVMQGLALTFAHAGFVVATWDFDGHADNPHPASLDIRSVALQENAESVLRTIQKLKLADSSRMAIVGHSMGTGVALSFGQIHPETRATVAISPIPTPVSAKLPQNLLLLAGSLEPDFVENARHLLSAAGGAGGQLEVGSARQLEVVAGVEHISIIFAPTTHTLALDWVNASLGVQSDARPYLDRRLLWYALAIIGTLVSAGSLIPRVQLQEAEPKTIRRRIAALVVGALSATLVLWLIGMAGLNLNGLLGLRVGGYLMLWFFVAGAVGLAVLKPSRWVPQSAEVLSGFGIFAALWLGIGLLGGQVWLPWVLISARFFLWPMAVLAVLPWCLLVGECSRVGNGWNRLLWWLIQSLMLFSALVLSVQLSPELGFLMLLLPLFPVILLFQVLPNLFQRGIWVFAISGALYVSWAILAVFPLL